MYADIHHESHLKNSNEINFDYPKWNWTHPLAVCSDDGILSELSHAKTAAACETCEAVTLLHGLDKKSHILLQMRSRARRENREGSRWRNAARMHYWERVYLLTRVAAAYCFADCCYFMYTQSWRKHDTISTLVCWIERENTWPNAKEIEISLPALAQRARLFIIIIIVVVAS